LEGSTLPSKKLIGAGVAAFLLVAPGTEADEPKPSPPDPAAVERATPSYLRYCASCHGLNGDGKGPSAFFIDPKPRDFTRGVFKWRSTPTGSLPVDQDLFRTIRTGVYATTMPPWIGLSDAEIRDLVAYVEHFSPSFTNTARGKPTEIPTETADTGESRGNGKQLYESMGCGACHGPEGHGDGASNHWPGLADDWGERVPPSDLTGEHLKSGNQSVDLYRILVTGLDGSAMPSYATSLTPAQTWDLVHYVQSLRKKD
jgi:cytochrome c oxidase cbb3-type subunit I/II